MKGIGIKNILNQVRMSVASNVSRKSASNSYKSTKLTTIQRITPSKPEQKFNYRTISSSSKTDKAIITVVKGSGIPRVRAPNTNLSKGMNDNFLFLRKENHLNTQFMIRKKKLKEITQANKRIYNRLNTQKSFYSNSDLSKSYESTKEIKERLSHSKLSHRLNSSRSSSRKSLKMGLGSKAANNTGKIQIKATNINTIDKGEINKFKALFIKNYRHKQQATQKDNVRFNSYRQDQYLPHKNKASARIPPSLPAPKQYKQSAILHRVVELMEDDKQGKENRQQQRRRSLVMPKNRKLFHF